MKVRPTSDRLRETYLMSFQVGVKGARFVDICAGTGAVGIEALSRGAAHVTFIEQIVSAAQVLEENLEHCGISENVKVIHREAISTLKYFAQHFLQFDYFYLIRRMIRLVFTGVVDAGEKQIDCGRRFGNGRASQEK